MKRTFSSRASYFFRIAVSFIAVSFICLIANIWLKRRYIVFSIPAPMNNPGVPDDTSSNNEVPEKRTVGRPRLPIDDEERRARHREAMRRYWQKNKIVLSQKAKMKRKVVRDAI